MSPSVLRSSGRKGGVKRRRFTFSLAPAFRPGVIGEIYFTGRFNGLPSFSASALAGTMAQAAFDKPAEAGSGPLGIPHLPSPEVLG